MVVAVHASRGYFGGISSFRDLAGAKGASFKATNFVPAWYVAWYGSWRTFVVDGESRCGQLGCKHVLSSGILRVCIQLNKDLAIWSDPGIAIAEGVLTRRSFCMKKAGSYHWYLGRFCWHAHFLGEGSSPDSRGKNKLIDRLLMLLHRERYSLRILEGPVGWGDLLMYENCLVISNWTWTFKDISQVNGLDQSIDIEVAFCCNQHEIKCTWGEYIQLHRDTTVGSLTLVPNLRNGVVSFDDSPLVSWWKVLGVWCLLGGRVGKAHKHQPWVCFCAVLRARMLKVVSEMAELQDRSTIIPCFSELDMAPKGILFKRNSFV